MALECLRLRVKNVAFTRNEIVVRDGKGGKDRVTMLPVDQDRDSHLFGTLRCLFRSILQIYSASGIKSLSRRVLHCLSRSSDVQTEVPLIELLGLTLGRLATRSSHSFDPNSFRRAVSTADMR